MRVISGKARHLKLKTLEGLDTRPTTDRIKETLFNMIQNDIYDCTFLDMFSGSGAIGIEALSRGAKHCVMVENNLKAIAVINDNLKFTKLEDNAEVLRNDAVSSISYLEQKNIVFDIVFMDPPYNKLLEKSVLEELSKSSIINENSLIIVEASLETDIDYLNNLGFELIKEKKYKTNKHFFIKKIGE